MSLMWYWVIALVVGVIGKWWYQWSNPKYNGKLPPGSMGFPIIGETFEFYKAHGLYEISPFVKKRMLRYGSLFRTNILGTNTVFSTDMDVNLKILREENKSFIAFYQNTSGRAFGKDNLFSQHGDIHKHIRQMTFGFLGPEGLKRIILGDLDRMTKEHLISKASQGSFDVDHAVSDLIITHITPKIVSNLKPENKAKLMDSIRAFNLDWCRPYLSLSILRALSQAITGRRNAIQVINDVCTQRKESKEKHTDFLDTLLEDLEKDGSLLSQGSAENLAFFLMFASRESASKAISLALKFIYENPKVLTELKREHEAILESRKDKESGITWEEYRQKMTFTAMVVSEVLRLTNLSPMMIRKVVKDVEINGYTIPEGWNVVVVPTVVHLDPKVYENPLEFDPWRWEGKDVRSGSKTFMVFGGGVRQCAGAEFARLLISIYLHYIVTKFDFSVVQDCEVVRVAALHLDKGLRIKLTQSV